MVHGWIKRASKKTCIKENIKQRKHLPTFLLHMGSKLYAETGCRKVYVGKVFE